MSPNPSKPSLMIRRLRNAVYKVRFLLRSLAAATSSSPWRVISLLRSSTGHGRTRLSLTDRHHPTGLLEAGDDNDDEQASESHAPSPGRVLHRRASSPALADEDDDGGDPHIDEKSEIFIQNFRRHLRLEKQLSLELRHIRGYSFTSSSSSSSSSFVSPLSSSSLLSPVSVTSP